jgi:hypothetical protein
MCEYNLIAKFLTSEVQRKLLATYLLIHFGLLTLNTQIMKVYESMHKGVYFLNYFMLFLLLNYIVAKIQECVWSTGEMIRLGKLK